MMTLPIGITQQAAGGGVVTTYVNDTFTDTDTTAIASHTPDTDAVGGGWIVDSGGLTISSNALLPSTMTGVDACRIDAGQSDCVITVSSTTEYIDNSNYANPAIFVHVDSGGTTGYSVYLSPAFSTAHLAIYGFVEATLLDQEDTIPEINNIDNVSYTLVVTVSGSTITGVLTVGGNDYTVTNASCTNNTSDTHYSIRHQGVGTYTKRAFDNFSITA